MNRSAVFAIGAFVALLGLGLFLSEQTASAGAGCHGARLAGRCHGGKILAGLRDRCDGGWLARRCHGAAKCDGLLSGLRNGGKCRGGLLGRRCHGGCDGGKPAEAAPPAAPETPPAPPPPPAAQVVPQGYIPVAFRN
ncbi:MAG: hypothetical protein KatS3mg110_1221 [Pirellulaceae bacterium]|nr:MAG: hypothetical protein KatS3mg110_1221 [Pirellulaceae bacterium]